MIQGYKLMHARYSMANPHGLDVRYARMLVQSVTPYDAVVEMAFHDHFADGKSLLDVVSLGVPQGATFDVGIYGYDVPFAFSAIDSVLSQQEATAAA